MYNLPKGFERKFRSTHKCVQKLLTFVKRSAGVISKANTPTEILVARELRLHFWLRSKNCSKIRNYFANTCVQCWVLLRVPSLFFLLVPSPVCVFVQCVRRHRHRCEVNPRKEFLAFHLWLDVSLPQRITEWAQAAHWLRHNYISSP